VHEYTALIEVMQPLNMLCAADLVHLSRAHLFRQMGVHLKASYAKQLKQTIFW